MPGRLFVATLGFNETFIVNTLNRYGASSGDGLLVVTLNPMVGGVKKALGNLAGLSEVMRFRLYEPLEIERSNIVESIAVIIDRMLSLAEQDGYGRIIVDVTGGPRIVIVATLLAAMIVSERLPVDVRVQDETGGDADLVFNMETLRTTLKGLGEKGRVLEYVVSHPGSAPGEIADALDIAPKTVANYLTYLKKLGLVAQKGRGRGVYPTEWGKLVAGLRTRRS